MYLLGLGVESGLPKEYVTTGLITLVFESVLLHVEKSAFPSLVGKILSHLAEANINLCRGTHLNPGPAGCLLDLRHKPFSDHPWLQNSYGYKPPRE